MQSIRSLFVMTLLTGALYPLAVTMIGQVLFKDKAYGSLLKVGGVNVGSELLAQKFLSQDSFWPRPSSSDFQIIPTGASNLGPTSQRLSDRIAQSAQSYTANDKIPFELLLASGSGLDPHLSPQAAKFQIQRISRARGLKDKVLEDLVDQLTEPPSWGVLGRPRVNVLKLNLALQELRK